MHLGHIWSHFNEIIFYLKSKAQNSQHSIWEKSFQEQQLSPQVYSNGTICESNGMFKAFLSYEAKLRLVKKVNNEVARLDLYQVSAILFFKINLSKPRLEGKTFWHLL